MTREAPPHERLARELVEGRVGAVRRHKRGLARAVDLRGRAAPRAVAAAVVPRQAQEMRRQQTLLGDAHPHTVGLEEELQAARDALYARGLP